MTADRSRHLAGQPAPDPAGHHAEARTGCPLSWRADSRAWLATGYAANHAGLRAPDAASVGILGPWLALRDRHGFDFADSIRVITAMPFNYEGETHARLRRLVATTIAPFADREAEFTATARRLLEKPIRDGGMDFAEDFANRLLFEIFCDLAVLDEADRAVLRPLSRMSWAIEATLPMRDRALMERTVGAAFALLTKRVPEVIAAHPESLLASLHRAMPAEEPDPVRQAIAMLAVFLLMGNDALGGSLAHGVAWLLDPERNGGATVPQARWGEIGDDLLRHTAAVDLLTRVFHADTELGGVPLGKGDRVMFSPQIANRDPARFGATADRISPDHKDGVGLTFGAGRHLCVGMAMSRNVVAAALSVLAASPPLRLLGPPRPAPGAIVRTMASMPVAFG